MVLDNDLVFRRIQKHIEDYTFVFDIDNTIVSDDGDVDDEFFQIAETMVDRNLNFTFATGRSYYFCKEVVERVKSKLPVICFDGQVLCDSETVMYKKAFTEIKESYIEELKKDYYIYFEDTYEIVTLEKTGVLFYSIEFGYPRKCIRVEHKIPSFDPIRIYFRKKRNDIEIKKEIIEESVYPEEIYTKVFPKGVWIMISPKTVDKIDACLELCKAYNIDINNIIFFGDDYNDLQLMRKCGTSVAMGDSIKDIIEIADLKIGSVKEKGVSTFLKKLIES